MHGMSVIVSRQFKREIVQSIIWGIAAVLLFAGAASDAAQEPSQAEPALSAIVKQVSDLPPIPKGMIVKYAGEATQLLVGNSLGDWGQIDFAGGREAEVKAGVLTIRSGEMLSGIYWDGDQVPKSNYEFSLEARRVGGLDFFCGAAVPVNESQCCLIVGGWAGATVGLSNIDGQDASSNATTKLMLFEDNRWYKIKIRVLPDRIITWIDGECVIYQNIVGKKISLRGDTDLLTPLGLCTFATTAEMRNIMLQRIAPELDPLETERLGQAMQKKKNILNLTPK